MKTLDCDGVILQVPEGWADIKLGTYETLRKMPQGNEGERIALIAAICGTTAEFLREAPVDVFNIVYDCIRFIFSNEPLPVNNFIEIDGVKWIVKVEDKLSLGEWIDAEEAQKGDMPLVGTLAVVCRPVGEKYKPEISAEREAFFAELSAEDVRPLLGFFLHCKHVLELRISVYGKLAQIRETLPTNIRHLARHGGGIRLLRIWPIIKFIYLTVLLKWRLRKF